MRCKWLIVIVLCVFRVGFQVDFEKYFPNFLDFYISNVLCLQPCFSGYVKI
jgi:hypothetical protein